MNDQLDLFGQDAAYYAFEGKFKPKKTTDDCYTPPIVYDAVAEWVAKTYGLDRNAFLRPFYPGGDFEREHYPPDSVVVDNPPFSILAKIMRFYEAHGVRYFLFAPTLTLFTATDCDATYYPCGVSVTYANGAVVNTSFVSNLDDMRIRVVPELYCLVDEANDRNLAQTKGPGNPKYVYPDEVITASMAAKYCKYGVPLAIPKAAAAYIGALDAQKRKNIAIFGGGYLLSEKAAAVVWQLSYRELELTKLLNKNCRDPVYKANAKCSDL